MNTYTTGDQYQPRVAMDENGDFIVAWTDNRLFAPTGGRDGSGRGIFAQRFDALARRQGGEFQVNTHTTGYQENAEIAIDAAGNFVIAWDSAGRGVSAQRFDASGNRLGEEIPVNSSTTGFEHAPDVAADPDGSFTVTWWREDPQDPVVLAQRFHADGTRKGGEFPLDSSIPAWWSPASVTTSGVGRFAVAWTAVDGAGVGIAARIGGETCAPDPGTLCLNGDRFQVQVTWSVPSQGRSGFGTAVPLTGDTGYFWFFDSANVELVVKALDGPQRQRPLLGLLRRALERRVHDHGDGHASRGRQEALRESRRHARQCGGRGGIRPGAAKRSETSRRGRASRTDRDALGRGAVSPLYEVLDEAPGPKASQRCGRLHGRRVRRFA